MCIFAALRPGLLCFDLRNSAQPLRGDPRLLFSATVCRRGNLFTQHTLKEPANEGISFSRIEASQGGKHRFFAIFDSLARLEKNLDPLALLGIGYCSA